MNEWETLWKASAQDSCSSSSFQERYRSHLLAQLVCLGRHTITSLITTCGRQLHDWTADYSLYAKERVDPNAIFKNIRLEIEKLNTSSQPLVIALDDTLLRKSGMKIPGTAYRRDPLGPPFTCNLIWAQRVIQYSGAVLGPNGEARMIPIALQNASTPRKPRKNSSEDKIQLYKEKMKQCNLNTLAVHKIHEIQNERMEANPHSSALHLVVDGSYTNRFVIKKLPDDTVFTGRIRKDAHLSKKPVTSTPLGRRRVYGDDLPTPEEMRKDENIPYQDIKASLGGSIYNFKVKSISPVRWRTAGNRDLRLIIIAPHRQILPNGRRRTRQPSYLICTDTKISIETIVQEYIWRWDIEVNHRDEKTLLGVGQAQVRNEHSVISVPASAAAAYSMLNIAAIKAYGWNGLPNIIPAPIWRDPRKKKRASTQDLINELRLELWSDSMSPKQLDDFINKKTPHTSDQKVDTNMCSAILACSA